MNILSKASTQRSKPFYFKKIMHLLCLAISISFLTACTTIQAQHSTNLQDQDIPINYYKYENIEEKLVYHLVTVYLDNPTITIMGTIPSNEHSFETIGETTESFAKKNDIFVAVNASPFSYPHTRLSAKRDIEGQYVYEGKVVSQPNDTYAALCFAQDNRAFIINSQNSESTKDAFFAFGGFWTILEGNTIHQFEDIKDARTAVGISADGYTLYILTVEKNKHSAGLNFMDCAVILQNAGAKKAIQLDGGGSTSLVFPQSPQNSVLSSRKVANSFGFFIKTP